MWYYETNRQVQGPITQSELLQLVNSGILSTQTLVWKEGLSTWIKITETGLLPQNEEGITPPPYDSVQPVPQNSPRIKRLSNLKWLYSFFLVGCGLTLIMLAGYPLLFSAILSENEAVIVTASMMYQIIYWGANASYVLEIILLFQFWKQVQDGNARTTPGKAIGFLFIPFYNLYWIFVAYWGLAKELKRYIFAHFGETGEEEIRKPKMFLSMLMSLSPFIYGLLIMAYIILFTVSIATKSPEFFQQDPQKVLISMIYPFMGIGGLLVLLRIAVYSDFYLSVRSILKEN